MKEIFYIRNGRQIGPVNIETLKPFEIKRETLVWHNGLFQWVQAKKIPRLNDYFKQLPPPIPKKRIKPQEFKYDLTYNREVDVATFGLALFFIPILLLTLDIIKPINNYLVIQQILLAIVAIIIRVAVLFLVITIAERQNRNIYRWGLFAFLLPSISLIIIGFLKRLNIEGKPSFFELIREKFSNYKSKERINYFAEEFKFQNKLLKIILIACIIGAVLLLLSIYFLSS